MGFPKALAMIDGETFLERIVQTLDRGGCQRIAAVTAEDPPFAFPVNVTSLINPRPERGMFSSLQVGLRHLAEGDCEVVVVALIDHPRVSPATVRALIGEHRASGAQIIRPRYRGRRGHPFLCSRHMFATLLAADSQADPRPLLRAAPHGADVDVEDAGILDDFDTPAALARHGCAKPAVEP